MQKSTFIILFLSFLNVLLWGQSSNNTKEKNQNSNPFESPFPSKSNSCQPFTVAINPLITSHAIIDTIYMKVCPYDTVIFAAEAIFTSQNPVYNQSQSNTKFVWKFADYNADTNQIISRIFNTNHSAELKMFAIDTLGCFSSNQVHIIVRVSGNPIVGVHGPIITSTGLETAVSVGYDTAATITIDTVTLFTLIEPQTIFVTTDIMAIPDGSNVCYNSTLNINSFPNDRVVQSLSDLKGIKLNIEHSYLGDLSIRVICPNGSNSILKLFSEGVPAISGAVINTCSIGGGYTQLGSVDDSPQSSSCYLLPGIGWDYEFKQGATNCFGGGGPTVPYSYLNSCGDTYTGNSLIPSISNPLTSTYTSPIYYGNYESLSNLIGCPFNGNWTLRVCDHFAVDNGYLFGWGLELDNYVLPLQEYYSITVDSVSWYGNNITPTSLFDATIGEQNIGVSYFDTKIYDQFGCKYDTSFAVYCFLKVEEHEKESIPVHFFPNPVSSDLHYSILNKLWENSSISIISIQGNPIYKTILTHDSDHFNVNFLSSGNYIIKVQNPEGKEYSVKIIVTK